MYEDVPREYLQLIYNRKRAILKLGQSVKRTNFDECAYEKGCRLGRKDKGKSTDMKELTRLFTVNNGLTCGCFLLHCF